MQCSYGETHHFQHMHAISGIGLECSEIANFEMGGGGLLPPYSAHKTALEIFH